MKKHIILINLILFTLFGAFAQEAQEANTGKDLTLDNKSDGKKKFVIVSSGERKGDKYFHHFSYSTAIGYYMDALENDADNQLIQLKIAECHRMLNDPGNAEAWYAKSLLNREDQVKPDYLLHYAQALSANQNYEEAKIWFSKYDKVATNDFRAQRKLKGLNDLSRFYEDSAYYKIFPVSINTPGLDFSPMWFKDGIVFVSGRDVSMFSNSEFNWDRSSYLDLFFSKAKANGDLENPVVFHKKVNTKFHEGSLAFYNNEENVVFTRNNYFQGKVGKSKEGITKLKLFFADRNKTGDEEEHDWINIRSFKFNDDQYSVGHPAISNDGQKMFFISDMPGGFGGTDIYVTYWRNDQWDTPINLGSSVNSEGMEMFPYLEGDDLYFASDGHEGLGGLDIYKSSLFDDKPVDLKNLGFPINSSYDDFGFIIKKGRPYGYFSTNRDDTVHDNIYFFEYDNPGDIFVRGSVINNHDSTIIAESRVKLMDMSGSVILDTLSDSYGNFEFHLDYKRHYKLSAEKPGFVTINVDSLYTAQADEIIENRILRLEPPHFVVSVMAIDKITNEPIPNAVIHCTDLKDKELVDLDPRETLHHEFTTTPGNDYHMTGFKTGYFSNSVQAHIPPDHMYDTLFYKIPMEKMELGKAIELENIYYDLNQSFIRADAAVELDKLVDILVDNPTIKIELGSHTDARGSDSYNQRLSQKRATAAVDYIVSKGIDHKRIVAKGYGETVLVNECSNDVACSKEKHQQNRRTEFKVTSY